MRKILTKEEIEKKKRRGQIIIGIILAGIMLLSTAGFAIFNREGRNINQGKITYNGRDFIKNENSLWTTIIENQNYEFYYNPKETENISIGFNIWLSQYSNKPLYFVSGNQDAKNEIIKNLWGDVLRSQEVCLQGESCNSELAVKNCTGNNIIILREKEQINIYKQENCVFIEAPDEEQARASDRLIFKLLGIQN